MTDRDPRGKTLEGFILGLTICSTYMKDGIKEFDAFGAEHDMVAIYVGLEELPEDSPDGRTLKRLGFHAFEGGWAYGT